MNKNNFSWLFYFCLSEFKRYDYFNSEIKNSTDASSSICRNKPCQNGGVCIVQADAYECKCSLSFTGANCQISIELLFFFQHFTFEYYGTVLLNDYDKKNFVVPHFFKQIWSLHH